MAEAVQLGTMPYAGPLTFLKGATMTLDYFVDECWGPSVRVTWEVPHRPEPQTLTNSVRNESDATDPHLEEAFRRARARGLIA